MTDRSGMTELERQRIDRNAFDPNEMWNHCGLCDWHSGEPLRCTQPSNCQMRINIPERRTHTQKDAPGAQATGKED